MSLVQLPGFSTRTSYRRKLAGDIPAYELRAAKMYQDVLRKKFEKASKSQKKEMYELMSEAVSRLLTAASERNRKFYTKLERTNFLKIAMIYMELKQEFGREVL